MELKTLKGSQCVLHDAIEKRLWNVATNLLELEAMPHPRTQSDNRSTLCNLAAKAGKWNMVVQLVERGDDPSAYPRSDALETPPTIFYAYAENRQDMVEFLLNNGASLDIMYNDMIRRLNMYGYIPLYNESRELTAMALLYFFTHSPQEKILEYGSANQQQKEFCESIRECLMNASSLPLLKHTYGKKQEPKIQLGALLAKLPAEHGETIFYICLHSELRKLGLFSDNRFIAQLEAISKAVFQRYNKHACSFYSPGYVYNAIFARIYQAMMNNPHLIRQEDRDRMQRDRQVCSTILFEQFKKLVEATQLNNKDKGAKLTNDVSLAARKRMSARAEEHIPNTPLALGDNTDFSWFFRYVMSGQMPVSFGQLVEERSPVYLTPPGFSVESEGEELGTRGKSESFVATPSNF